MRERQRKEELNSQVSISEPRHAFAGVPVKLTLASKPPLKYALLGEQKIDVQTSKRKAGAAKKLGRVEKNPTAARCEECTNANAVDGMFVEEQQSQDFKFVDRETASHDG